MKVYKSDRGFVRVTHEGYTEPEKEYRVVGESSAVGDYEDSLENPGSSFLWVGDEHLHLNREEVQELIEYMANWLRTGRLLDPKEEESIERE